ncbi:hypothetical protein ACFQX8_21910 [Klenkia terrae]|uniref:hypothetical protein n=1 Tax=Klenkia terrae TaxID=1052259 RepID=UPI00361C94F7
MKRRRPLRTVLITLAAVVVLGAAAVGFYAFVGNHWFVRSVDEGDIGVYRGINASIVGLDLYRLDTATDLAYTDLTQAARSRVGSGIEADDRADAERILENLRQQLLPLCRTTEASATTSASPSPTTSAPTTTDPGATGTPALPTTSSAPSTTAQTSTSTRTQEPGVDCREAG